MEDEKGLDLSLGLGRVGSSSEIKSSEEDRDRKMINEFKNFLEGGNHHALKFGENYPPQYGAKASMHIEPLRNSSNEGGNWLINESRFTDIEDEGRLAVGEKRKSLFTKIDPKKKHTAESSHSEFKENPKASHISIGDEGSTAENEDVADSEADGSSSKHFAPNDDAPEQFPASSSKYLGQKDGFGDSENTEAEKDLNVSLPFGVSFPVQPSSVNINFSQAVKDLKSSGTLCLPSYPLPGIGHAERANAHPIQSAHLPLTFGYPSTQLPTLDRDNSRGVISNQQLIHPAFPGRNQEHGRQHSAGQEEMSSHSKNDAKDRTGQHQAETIPSEFQAIRPGMAADLKFGGSGSYPNLPWVSTTSPNPNGRTISGVTYRFSPTQVKIVCACHGSHMSPEEFIRHASEDTGNPPETAALASLPNTNPAASAQS